MPSRNAILATCVGYDLHHVEPFLVSALRNAPSADIVLIARNMGQAFHRFVEVHDRIHVVEFRNAADNLHPQCSRYFSYLQYLSIEGVGYEKVLLADIRDVVFQGDLFAAKWPGDLVVAVEDARVKREPYNQAWLLDMYGTLVATFMQDREISCSGTTCGTRKAILNYLFAMTAELLRQERWTGRVGIEGTGYDQGVHNYLLWKQKLEGAVVDRHHAILSTVGLTRDDVLTVDGNGMARMEVVAPVVHQWDRHPKFAQHVERHFRGGPDA